MMNSIKLIYFDLGGIFFEWEKAFSSAAKRFDRDIQQLIQIFVSHDEEITKGSITPQEFWMICRDELGIKEGKNYDFLDHWTNDYVPILEGHQLAEKYSGKYKIGVISNIYKGMYPMLLEKSIIPNLSYDPIILSCDVGMRKPEVQILELAQEKSGVDSKEILFIDDSKKNLDIANKLGWQTFLFETYKPAKSILGIERLLK